MFGRDRSWHGYVEDKMDQQERMRLQTEAWCMSIPNHKKNMSKMQMVIVNGFAKFIPK